MQFDEGEEPRPITMSDVWKLCTACSILSICDRNNVVTIQFHPVFGKFELPYAHTCDKILQLPYSLEPDVIEKSLKIALKFGTGFTDA